MGTTLRPLGCSPNDSSLAAASALLTRTFIWTPASLGRLIYFDTVGVPQEQPLVFHFTWQGFIMAPYRPYRDPLRATFRSVFEEFGLPWRSRESQFIAIMLALFGGMLWLHEFYAGSRRRAGRNLALFYLLFLPVVHIVLRWADAVYLAIVVPMVPIGLGWIAASRRVDAPIAAGFHHTASLPPLSATTA